MKKLLLLAFVAIGITSCSVTSKSEEKKEMTVVGRKVAPFTEIHVNGSPTVIYTQAPEHSVKVKAAKNLIDRIKTASNGRCLTIETKGELSVWGFSRSSGSDFMVYVTSPDLTGVELSGSGDFKSEKPIDTDNIHLTVRGSGDLSIDGLLICDNAQLSVTGSGDLEVDNLEAITSGITLIGSGSLKVKQRNVVNTQMQLTGSGDITLECEACDNVNSQLTGSGDITIRGSVKKINKTKAGSGEYKVEK